MEKKEEIELNLGKRIERKEKDKEGKEIKKLKSWKK